MKNLNRALAAFFFLLLSNALFGQYDWAYTAASNNFDEATGTATDQLGNTYVLGNFEGTSKAFSTLEGPITLTNAGQQDFFVIKYNPDHDIEWVQSYGGPNDDEGLRISTSSNGLVAIVGTFRSPSLTASPLAPITNLGGLEGFILTIDENGSALWLNGVNGLSDDFFSDVEVTETSVLAVGRMTSSSVTVSGISKSNLGPAGSSDVLIASFDLLGNANWVHNYGGTGEEFASGIAINGNRVYMTGSWQENIAGTPLSLGALSSGSNYGYFDGFCTAFDISNGTYFHWIQTAGGIVNDHFRDVTTDKDGGVYVHGDFKSYTFDIDPTVAGPLATEFNVGTGTRDLCVVKFEEEEGTPIWVQHPRGWDDEEAHAIEADGCGNIYITGHNGLGGVGFVSPWFPHFTTGPENAYLAQYDSDGNYIFSASLHNSDDPSDTENFYAGGRDIGIDIMNRPYFVGHFNCRLTVPGVGLFPALFNSRDFYILRRNTGILADWQHTSSLTGTEGKVSGVDVAVDSDGDIYATGTFTGPTTFGAGSETVNLTRKGMYVTKYSSCGRLLWAAQTNTTDLESRAIAIDEKNGWVYVCGNYSTALPGVFGPGVSPDLESCGIGTSLLAGPSSYVIRYDMSDGCIDQVKPFYGTTKCNGVDVDDEGNIFVAQEFETAGVARIRALKMNSSFAMVWQGESDITGISDAAYVNDIVVGNSPSGEQFVYLTGKFKGELAANSIPSVHTAAIHDAYVWHIYDNGTGHSTTWIRKAGVVVGGFAEGLSISCDPKGNGYVTGEFQTNLGPNVFGAAGSVTGNPSFTSAFVSRIDAGPVGVASWTTPITAAGGVTGTGISGDNSGLYITGYWNGGSIYSDLTFPVSQGIAPQPWVGFNPNPRHVYQARYDYEDGGVDTWGLSSDGEDQSRSFGVAVNNSGFSYITGEYTGDLKMPAVEMTSTPTIQDAFIVRTDKEIGVVMKTAPIAEETDEGLIQEGPKVFPNPSNGVFNIEFPNGENGSLKVYDLQGKMHLSQKTLDGQSTLSLKHLAKGVYILNWTQGNGTRGSKKLIIQ